MLQELRECSCLPMCPEAFEATSIGQGSDVVLLGCPSLYGVDSSGCSGAARAALHPSRNTLVSTKAIFPVSFTPQAGTLISAQP